MVEAKAPIRLPVTNLGLNQEGRPVDELDTQTTRGLFLRKGSPQEVSRIVSMSINPPLDLARLTDEEKITVLAAKFWSQGLFAEGLENWNDMLAIINRNKRERNLQTLLCLETFYDARRNGFVDSYYEQLVTVFGKLPSPLANDHKSITNVFAPKYYANTTLKDDSLSADMHRFRRSKSKKKGIIEESPLDVKESVFFE